MTRPGIDGSFFLCWGLNLVLNIWWALPGVALFIAHFAFDTPLWWAGLAFALWIVIVGAITLALRAIGTTGKANSAGTGIGGKATIRRSSQRQHAQGASAAPASTRTGSSIAAASEENSDDQA